MPSLRNLGRDQAEGKEAADDEPDGGSGERDQEGRARRPLLEREDQAADRGNVVIGGRGQAALRGRARGALGAHELAWRGGSGLGLGVSANSKGGFGGDRLLGLLRRLLAFRLDDPLALALLGLEPLGEGGSFREFEASLEPVAGLLVSGPGQRVKRLLILAPPLPQLPDFACSCAITRSSQPTKTHERMLRALLLETHQQRRGAS